MSDWLLQVRGVSKNFGGINALDRVSFSVLPGEVIGVIGPNGSGKSTLSHLITGFLKPCRGEIHFCGRNITSWAPENRIRLGISRSFQKTRLFFSFTVEDNILAASYLIQSGGLGRALIGTSAKEEAALQDHVEHIISICGLKEFRHLRAEQLSFGYQRRLEIAIALSCQPKLLLLDEPFGGLSPSSTLSIISLIQDISAKGCSVMFIEHRLDSIVSCCTRLFALQRGKLVIPKGAH